MGAHRNNPTAQAAARGEFRPPPGSVVLGFSFETVLELNKETIAEVTKDLDFAKAANQDPRPILQRYNPKEHPERFDYVVYNRPSVGRPSPLAIRQDQIPTAQLRWSEHIRIPYAEVMARADEQFANFDEGKRH